MQTDDAIIFVFRYSAQYSITVSLEGITKNNNNNNNNNKEDNKKQQTTITVFEISQQIQTFIALGELELHFFRAATSQNQLLQKNEIGD